MCYMVFILQNTPETLRAQEICHNITWRLYLWDPRQHSALVSDTVTERRSWLSRADHVSEEIEVRDLNSKVLNVKLRASVRVIHGQGMGKVYILTTSWTFRTINPP